MRSSFWLVIILVFLFIAALSFIDVMSKGHGHEGEGAEHHTEAAAGHHGSEGHAAEAPAAHEEHAAAPADSAHAEHH